MPTSDLGYTVARVVRTLVGAVIRRNQEIHPLIAETSLYLLAGTQYARTVRNSGQHALFQRVHVGLTWSD